MTTPAITASLIPAIDVLAKTLALTGTCYQHLLTQSPSFDLCCETGKTLRYVSDRYAKVLLAALAYPEDSEEEPDNWEEKGNTPVEEEWDE